MKLPHWLVAVFAALSPALIAMSLSLPVAYQGPAQTLGIAMAGLAGLMMPAPSWMDGMHPIIPSGMIGMATLADAMLKQWADAAQGMAKVGLYAAACLLAWAAGLHAPAPVQGSQAPAPGVGGAAKALFLTLAAALVLGLPRPAQAQGFDWAAGPTVPFLELDPGNPHPVSIAAGAGMQVSVTHDALKRAILGKSWDLLDLDLMAFGSVINSQGGEFGVLSVAAAACTASSLICIGGGKHVLSPDGAFANGGWFGMMALSINFALAPSAPPVGVEKGAAGLSRGNTLYLGDL